LNDDGVKLHKTAVIFQWVSFPSNGHQIDYFYFLPSYFQPYVHELKVKNCLAKIKVTIGKKVQRDGASTDFCQYGDVRKLRNYIMGRGIKLITELCTAYGKGLKSSIQSCVIYERSLWISILCKK
jgi:hypothetical protein